MLFLIVKSHQIGGLEAALSTAFQRRFSLLGGGGGGGALVVGSVTVLQVSLQSSGVRRHVATQSAAVFEVLRHVVQVHRTRSSCCTHTTIHRLNVKYRSNSLLYLPRTSCSRRLSYHGRDYLPQRNWTRGPRES